MSVHMCISNPCYICFPELAPKRHDAPQPAPGEFEDALIDLAQHANRHEEDREHCQGCYEREDEVRAAHAAELAQREAEMWREASKLWSIVTTEHPLAAAQECQRRAAEAEKRGGGE